MNREDIMFLKVALLSIFKKSDANCRDVYGIVKTAFYAQRFIWRSLEAICSTTTICALPFGPVPSSMYNILKMARGVDREMDFM